MRRYPLKWYFVLLLCAAGLALLFYESHVSKTRNSSLAQSNSSAAAKSSVNSSTSTNTLKAAAASAVTNKFAWRLSNTGKPIKELVHDPHALLLENAFIDTSAKINLSIPKNLQSKGDPGAYVVQARGPIGPAFRILLADVGASIVSYIPNNAYLVRTTQAIASGLAASPLVQAVIPYEPYYKVQSSLISMADKQLPPDVQLNLALFPDDAQNTIQQIEQDGGKVLAREDSLAGYPVVKVEPPADWTTIVGLPGVHIAELPYRRAKANDLARPMLGVAADSITPTNYMNLYGSNVLIDLNDDGVDTNHPDFTAKNTQPSRVFGLVTNSADDGHGTHVAGIIAGDGSESSTVINASGSFMPGTNNQFRGKAPFARVLSVDFTEDDRTLQETAATNNALISNNSWNYANDLDYDLEAASYDAATRDSLALVSGSQPVLYVFSAGNNDIGPTAGNIFSPATAKDLITVGALEELRNITNQTTNAEGVVSTPWLGETDNSSAVADFSNCGNVGIGTEGTFGRFKPDVVAPGTFVVSCRSAAWDVSAYYNPTNNSYSDFPDFLPTNAVSVFPFQFFVPTNAVNVFINTVTNNLSPPGTNLPPLTIYADTNGSGQFALIGTNSAVIGYPIDGTAQNLYWSVVVSNTTATPIAYDLLVDVQTTNDYGNYYLVLSNLNDNLCIGPPFYYRYESGTSMAAASISGFLALMQDYFTNNFSPHFIPSPALLKALTINGARVTAGYDFQVNNSINYEGWGLPDLSNSIPVGLTNLPAPSSINQLGPYCSTFFREQSPTNALATGDSETFTVHYNGDILANFLPLRVTLTWTDPPGDPAAALKLVNSLELVVTDLDNPGVVYYGNDISAGNIYNTAESTNNPPIIDTINNVQNIYIDQVPFLGDFPDTNYSITVIGNSVNVNAVSAHTNNTVQDFALVISAGDMGLVSNAFQVTDGGIISNPTGDQNITLGDTNMQVLLNQIAGANTPLLGSNTVAFTSNAIPVGTNGQFTIGMTNQWHFYIVTNTTTFTNAAFIAFGAQTLSIPRMGVFANSDANSTTPGADIDLLVSVYPNDPNAMNLLTLDPNVVSNCVNNANGDGGSLAAGGTDFVTYSNAVQNQVYYIGVKSESQMAAIYGFVPIFTDIPFSGLDQNGNEFVNGLNVPAPIPDGTPSHPGLAFVFALALYPIEIQDVIVTNVILHQNFGNLVGSLTHSGTTVVLNSHDSYVPPGPYTLIYDDTDTNDVPNSQPSDGPGSLRDYQRTAGEGVWQLTEEGTAIGQTGEVLNTSIFLKKYQNPALGVSATIPPHAWFYTFVDVPNGVTNLQVYGAYLSNSAPTPPPLQMYLNYNSPPAPGNFLFEADLTNPPPLVLPPQFLQPVGPWNVISDGPPLQTGTYYIGVTNPSPVPQTVYLVAILNGPSTPPQPTLFTTTNISPITVDAVTNTSIFVSNSNTIESANVGIVVQYPRISDLAFTLISPSGQRILLMENRGGPASTNAGGVFFVTNNIGAVAANGSFEPNTNYIDTHANGGSFTISYNMFTIPDEMTIYYGTNPATFFSGSPEELFDSGLVSGSATTNIQYGPGTSTYITIIMNQFGNTNAGSTDAWTYNINGVESDFNYLTFTDDTNLTMTPIKFAIPPFDLRDMGTNISFTFDFATNGDYFSQTNIYDPFGGWNVPTNLVTQVITNVFFTNNYNQVSIVSNPAVAFNGTNFLALGYGIIQRTNFVTPYRLVTFSYEYRGPGIAGWWRGEGDGRDSSDAEQRGQDGTLIGRFGFPAGQVSQAFKMENNGQQYDFAGTNGYVQIRQQPFLTQAMTIAGTNDSGGNTATNVTVQSSYLDVGTGSGFTVEGWINPTNVTFQQPLVEWLARVPTNGSDTNLTIKAGPFLYRGTDHYYYMLGATNWTTSETWATQIGGHLVTLDSANEQNWVFDTFGDYGGRNRNLWIGLTNLNQGSFGYSGGLTNIAYTNWLSFQPTNCDGTRNYTFILGSTNTYAGLWALADNDGIMCGPVTNICYGVVEVTNLDTNGVQFWISVTNVPGTTNMINATNGCLFANLVDITNGSHWIYSGPNLVQSNTWQHVALTYDTNSGNAMLFYDGTNVATTNWGGPFIPKTTGDVLLGKDMSLLTNNFYGGQMDEISIYNRALSDAEIQAIYSVSAYSTNRLVGKFDPSITPPLSLAEAQVVVGTMTNTILGQNNTWQQGFFSFETQTNMLPVQISGIQPGMLFDSFSYSEAPLGNLYYQPEQSLDELKGENAQGNWTLEIWDTRNNTLATNAVLLSWQLQMILQTNTLPPVNIEAQTPTTVTVPPGQIITLAIPVPTWASTALNTVTSSLPLNVFFNATNFQYASPPDVPIMGTPPPVNLGSELLTTTSIGTMPTNITPGETYYIGLANPGTQAATAVFEVDFNIIPLTNAVPYNDTLTNSVRYFSFDVSTNNPYEATFQLLKTSGSADLVVSKGTLPTLTSADYGSFNSGNANENIYVLTNSTPVPLSPGPWYLGVFNRGTNPVNYSVLAQELDLGPPAAGLLTTNLIALTNGVPFDYTAGPGAALTNFFVFQVTNTWTITNSTTTTNYVPSIHFELYNLTGNGDLTVQTNAPPFAPPFYQSSQEPGTIPEFIQIGTNSTLTNLAAMYYLGVPNETTNLIHFTIIAVIDTNNVFPAFPGAEGAGAGALGGSFRNANTTNNTVYHVVNLNDSGTGSLRDAVSSTNRTVIFDISGPILLKSPLVITNSCLTIVGQTSPTGGVTVAGAPAIVSTNVHDVVIRYLRFRPDYLDPTTLTESGQGGDALQLNTVSNIIADHISALWSSNNDLSVLNSSNVTVQWSILSDTLATNGQPPPFGALVRYGSGAVTLHHNLFADNYTGSPRLGDDMSLDFVNNIIYNWATNSGYSSANDIVDDPSGFTNYLNFRCNYLIAGPDTITTNIAFWGGTNSTWLFQTNNFIDSVTNGFLNGADTKWLMFTNWNAFTNLYTKTNEFRLPPVSVDEAYMAYEKVLDFAGVAMFQREPADTNVVENVRLQAGSIIGSPGILATNSSTLIYLNSSGDGIPDFWKITFGQAVTNNYNNFALDSSGYSELEEFDNWLAGPHAATATNTPVGVDLQQLFGKTGNLSFIVTNAVQGFVYLTNVLGSYTNTGIYSNSIAIFTPTNNPPFTTNYSGFASFDVFVTNNDTVAWFGPVTVSVFVGSTEPTYSQFVGILLPDPVTNNIGGNTIQWYQINVPTNAIVATNTLVFAGEPLNVWFSTNQTTVYPSDAEMLTDVTNGVAVLYTNGVPTLVPGTTYYLGIQNTNNTGTTYAVGLDYELAGSTPITGGTPVTNTVPVGGTNYYSVTVPPNAIAATNIIDFANGGSVNLWFNQNMLPGGAGDYPLLSGFSGATPGIGSPILTLSSTPPLVPGSTYYLAVQNAGATPVTYAIEVDFELFYTPPVLPNIPTNLFAVAGTTFTVTNTATDTNSGTLFYFLTTQPSVGATIDTNGVITWNVPANEPATNILFTTIVSNSFTAQTATNNFTVTVIPIVSGTGPQTNTVPGGSIDWLVVDVPTNAVWATNTLLFATNFPVNVLFTTNFPPSTNGAYTLMSNETNGTSILGLNTVPTNIVPGGVYYLGVQNTNSVAVNYAIVVTFDLVTTPGAPFSQTLPATMVTSTSAQLNGFATPNAFPASAWFEYGVNTNYQTTTAPQALNGGNNVQYVTNPISGLLPVQVYHYRLDVSNAFGVVHGPDQLFGVSGVAVWGQNIAGVTNVPLGVSNEVSIAAEMEDGVALNSQGRVTVWGDNTFSQTVVPVNLTNVANIAAGNGFFALALQNGTVTGWGDNSSGQLNVPAGLNNVVAIAAGEFHGLALQNNGTVVAWGANGYGQTSVPTNLNNVVAIAAGSVNSLALLNNGTVVAWGGGETNTGVYPDYGQSIVPPGLSNVVAISSYGYTSTALKSDGTVVAWGENNFGQANVPGGLNDVAAIANGLYHSLAVQETGLAVGWGNDTYGETNIPAGLTNIYAIAGGNYFSMALESPLSINLNVTPITGGSPQTNSVAADSVVYYSVTVPANATAATNLLSFATANLNLWFNQSGLALPTNPPSTLLFTGASGASAVLTTSSTPPLAPGQTYFLAIQNTNTMSVSYVFGVNFSFTSIIVSTNPIPISSIVYTNIGGTNGFLLSWFAPTNDIFQVQETPNLIPATWLTFTNIIPYTGPPTNANGLFQFFDNGSEYPFGPMRFYRLLLISSGTVVSPPVLPAISNQVAYAGTTFTLTNTAIDPNPGTLSYTLTTSPSVSATISSSGVITWAVPTNQPTGGIQFTTVVVNASTTLSATNSFTVNVQPAPTIFFTSIINTNMGGFNGFLLSWYAPTNDTFQVQETPLLEPVGWVTFTNIITYTGPLTPTNGLFQFFDNGVKYPFTSERFYRLLLLLQSSSGGNSLTLSNLLNYIVSVSQPFAITNAANDSNPSAILGYSLVQFPAPATNATIGANNGVIKWEAGPNDAGKEFKFTTSVGDNGAPPATATNQFTVFVTPYPSIAATTVTSTNTTMLWAAPSNDLFQVEWTTNLVSPVVWTAFPQTVTSTTNSFTFTDTNAPVIMKFYRLIWLPLP